MKKIALIPIDNRPICTTLIEQICAVDKNIKLFMPNRLLLGDLHKTSNSAKILSWLENLSEKIDYLIISLDTIAYGGLITSRRCDDAYEEVISRIKHLERIIKSKKCKTYAFSSIMRISNNNVNEEEKEYWSQWGKKIFEYSYYTHKARCDKQETCIENRIPKEILDDYLATRKRNFDVNRYYLELKDVFDYIVYSKDDTGKYGLNVEEAEILSKEISEKKVKGIVKTGADEIPLSLLSRAITDNECVKIKPIFLEDASKSLISKYEDISIYNCVKDQIELGGATYCEQNPDIEAIINNFKFEQGDLVLGDVINASDHSLKTRNKPTVYIDVNNANGADNGFVNKIFKLGYSKNIYGYSGYNTSANSIGCALCIALVKYFAKKYDEKAFKKLLAIRFLDDWGYQAHVRKNDTNFDEFENRINDFLKTNYKNISYKKPWNRTFEIEITIN